MGTYLVVARQTATSPELVEALLRRKLADADARFVLLVPEATQAAPAEQDQPSYLVEDLARHLSRAGVQVIGVETSTDPPLAAIGAELAQNENKYAGIIIATFAPGISRWLQHDLLSEINKRFQIPVQHVIAVRSEQKPISVQDMHQDAELSIVDRGNVPMA